MATYTGIVQSIAIQAWEQTFAGPPHQYAIQAFLQTLVLFPPDDTASNLNPGNPATQDPQTPSEHGSIFLPALFQIPEGGAE